MFIEELLYCTDFLVFFEITLLPQLLQIIFILLHYMLFLFTDDMMWKRFLND
jgi:hypothetical protein